MFSALLNQASKQGFCFCGFIGWFPHGGCHRSLLLPLSLHPSLRVCVANTNPRQLCPHRGLQEQCQTVGFRQRLSSYCPKSRCGGKGNGVCCYDFRDIIYLYATEATPVYAIFVRSVCVADWRVTSGWSKQTNHINMASIKVKFRFPTALEQEGTIYYQVIHERKVRRLPDRHPHSALFLRFEEKNGRQRFVIRK